MNPTLEQRLDIFRSMPEVPDEAVDLVAEELTRIDPAGRLDDDQAGMFVSHAVNALARLGRSDHTVTAPDDAVFVQVLEEDPQAADDAGSIAARVESRFGRPLPDAEVQFLAIHLAALRQHLSKEIS